MIFLGPFFFRMDVNNNALWGSMDPEEIDDTVWDALKVFNEDLQRNELCVDYRNDICVTSPYQTSYQTQTAYQTSYQTDSDGEPVYMGADKYWCCPRRWCNYCAPNNSDETCHFCIVREQGPDAQGIFYDRKRRSWKRGHIFALSHLDKTVEIDAMRQTVMILDGYNGEPEHYDMGRNDSEALLKTHGKEPLRGVLRAVDDTKIRIDDMDISLNPRIGIKHITGSPPTLPEKAPPLRLSETVRKLMPTPPAMSGKKAGGQGVPRKKAKKSPASSSETLPPDPPASSDPPDPPILQPSSTTMDELPPLAAQIITEYNISRRTLPGASIIVKDVVHLDDIVRAVATRMDISPPFSLTRDDVDFDEALFRVVHGKKHVVHLFVSKDEMDDEEPNFSFADVLQEANSDRNGDFFPEQPSSRPLSPPIFAPPTRSDANALESLVQEMDRPARDNASSSFSDVVGMTGSSNPLMGSSFFGDWEERMQDDLEQTHEIPVMQTSSRPKRAAASKAKKYKEDALSDPESDVDDKDDDVEFDYFKDRSDQKNDDVDSEEEDMLADMDSEEIGRQYLSDLFQEEQEEDIQEDADGIRNPEYALQNGLPQDIIFPNGFFDPDLADVERERLVNIYKNSKQLNTLGLEDKDYRYLSLKPPVSSTRKKYGGKGPSARPSSQTVLKRQQAEKRAGERVKEKLSREMENEEKRRLKEEQRKQREEDRLARLANKPKRTASSFEERKKNYEDATKVHNEVCMYHPWSGKDPGGGKGRMSVTWAQVPDLLKNDPRIRMGMDKLRKPTQDERGETDYKSVGWASGPKKDGKKFFRGYVVQQTIDKHTRRICVVNETVLAALMSVAATLDPRLQWQKCCQDWIAWIIEGQDENVQKWLQELPAQEAIDFQKNFKLGKGGRPPALAKRMRGEDDDDTMQMVDDLVGDEIPLPTDIGQQAAAIADVTGLGLNESMQALQQFGSMDNAIDNILGSNSISDDDVMSAMHNGQSIASLKQRGATTIQLRAAAVPVEDLVGVYSIRDILNAGYSVSDLHASGVNLSALQDSVPVRDLLEGGYSLQDIVSQGVPLRQLARAGVTPFEMNAVGFADSELAEAGFTIG